MMILAYSRIPGGELSANMGLPQYSYYFVLEKFRPVLQKIGDVIEIWNDEQISYHTKLFAEQGLDCILLSFTPPQDIPENVDCPVVCIFAWEFSNIPDDTWDDNPNNDWRVALSKVQAAITLSRHTENIVKRTLGEHYPVTAIPVPLWDRFEDLRACLPRAPRKHWTLDIAPVSVIDSRDFDIRPDILRPLTPEKSFRTQPWDGSGIHMDFIGNNVDSGRLCGFYDPEPWGVWSRLPSPWIILPVTLSGPVIMEFEAVGFGANAGREIEVALGDTTITVRLSDQFSTTRIEATLADPVNVMRFDGLMKSRVGTLEDHRTLGMGIRWLRILPRVMECPPVQTIAHVSQDLTLNGIVYTMVFNPVDQRKNWVDVLTAFCHAFRDTEDAILILKMSHRHIGSFAAKLLYLLEQMQPLRCRVIALHGFMDEPALKALISHTTYYLNASLCEGLCMPLMEFMCAGVPGISTRNTAMEDYVSESTHFIVESSLSPTIWPHDPHQIVRTLQYRVNWESLEQRLRESYTIASGESSRYRVMSRRSLSTMGDYCSESLVHGKLLDILYRTQKP